MSIPDIPAQQLDNIHIIEVTTASGVCRAVFTPLSYIESVLSKGGDAETIRILESLYMYYKAAKDYRVAH